VVVLRTPPGGQSRRRQAVPANRNPKRYELDRDAWIAVRETLTPSQRKAFNAYQERMDVLIEKIAVSPEVINENSLIANFVGELYDLIKAIPWL
jgi:hypothetical protein